MNILDKIHGRSMGLLKSNIILIKSFCLSKDKTYCKTCRDFVSDGYPKRSIGYCKVHHYESCNDVSECCYCYVIGCNHFPNNFESCSFCDYLLCEECKTYHDCEIVENDSE